jgi:hypothetical protein
MPMFASATGCGVVVDVGCGAEWAGVLTPEDLRGLTPLFWAHVLPYGEVNRVRLSWRDVGSSGGFGDLAVGVA